MSNEPINWDTIRLADRDPHGRGERMCRDHYGRHVCLRFAGHSGKHTDTLIVWPFVPAPVRLTVEEAMYWMGRMLAHAHQYGSEESYLECALMVASAGMGDVEGLHRAASMGLEDIQFARRFGGSERPLERFGRMKWWLCRQAIGAIGRERGR